MHIDGLQARTYREATQHLFESVSLLLCERPLMADVNSLRRHHALGDHSCGQRHTTHKHTIKHSLTSLIHRLASLIHSWRLQLPAQLVGIDRVAIDGTA